MLELSIVIPAYNETTRLPPYLTSIRAYMESAFANRYEIIVVDDGSIDGLSAHLQKRYANWSQLHVLRHAANQGKGAALRSGMASTTGQFVLFADADGATSIEEEQQLRQALIGGADVAVGSRLTSDLCSERTTGRSILGRLFARIVASVFDLPVRDTQCGFKMLRRDVARRIFQVCRETGYLLDIEVLLWAQRFQYRVTEIPIRYKDVPGSKVRLIRDGLVMLQGVYRLKRATISFTRSSKHCITLNPTNPSIFHD